MDKSQQLREIVGRLAEVDAETINGDFSLSHRSLQGSAGRARLDALVRSKMGVKSPAVYTVKTFGELEGAVCGTTTPTEPKTATVATTNGQAVSTASAAPVGGLMCGIDLEEVSKMPESADYWGTEFYTHFFSPREIAYCVGKERPREHFAARWCAKEALKKCDPAFIGVEMNQIEVMVEESGKPFLRAARGTEWVRLPHAVSLSHTSAFATAVVVASGNK